MYPKGKEHHMQFVREFWNDELPHSKYEFCQKYGVEASTAGSRIRQFRSESKVFGWIVKHEGKSVYQLYKNKQGVLPGMEVK